ncbi:MAG: response regulator [Lachnospiraceae bacterium]|nr:response regulator [Lachnospiraceae bacterium]
MNYERNDKEIPKILIVDDVESNRFILKNIIEDMGCQPILAENGVQALKVCAHCSPQLILLDISMPEMDGYEFCGIMKDNPATRSIPIIFISAFDETKDIVKGFELGGEDYVTKPFIPEVIKSRVGVHLKISDMNKNLVETNRRLKALLSEQAKQMEDEKKSVLYALANVAKRNMYEEGSVERMQKNVRVLTQAMQLSDTYEHLISDTYIDSIEMAINLCDIGNVAISRDILWKQSSLTDEEIAIMRTHTNIGAKLLEDISISKDNNEFMKMSIDIARHHHENWDGSGYPDGLKGDEIPLSAQIVSVINTYGALTEARSWREAYSSEEAIEIMKKDAGKRFNVNLIDICSKIYRRFV